MARADVLVGLLQAHSREDKVAFRKAAEALISDEKGKGHTLLSARLANALTPASRTVSNSRLSTTRPQDLFHEIEPERRLCDLLLPKAVQNGCESLIEEQHRAELLHAHSLRARNRLLLAGAPGNGKTSLAEAIATELMVPLLVIRYESLIGCYLGETATRLKNVMEIAKTQRCVLFLDEFETIGKERGDTHETGEIKRVVSSLLLQIDDLPDYVVIIAASNHPELLDRAVWRRFQLRMELPPPTVAQRAALINRIMQRCGVNPGYQSTTLAKRIGVCCFAEVEQFCLDIVRGAVLAQKTDKAKSITTRVLAQWRKRFSLK